MIAKEGAMRTKRLKFAATERLATDGTRRMII